MSLSDYEGYKPSESDEPLCSPDECYFIDEFMALGFGALEAFTLVVEHHLSPSTVREFMRHHPTCAARQAVQILL